MVVIEGDNVDRKLGVLVGMPDRELGRLGVVLALEGFGLCTAVVTVSRRGKSVCIRASPASWIERG